MILPERRYDIAGKLLATAIEDAAVPGTTLAESLKAAAAGWGCAVADQARAAAGPEPSPEQLLACACHALAANGYEPHRTGGTVLLRNCPFDVLAREHTELVCGLNVVIMTAMTEQLQDIALAARLEPAPDRCCVVLVPTNVPAMHRQPEESTSLPPDDHQPETSR